MDRLNKAVRRCVPVLLLTGLLAACATQGPTATQELELRLSAPEESSAQVPHGVPCKLSNSAGSWALLAPGTVTILRTGDALMINCENEQWVMAEQLKTEADNNIGKSALGGAGKGAGIGLLWGALATPLPFFTVPAMIVLGVSTGAFYGGITGAVVDGHSGAAFAYQPQIVVQLRPRPASAEPVVAEAR
jgi:hypothetical protein